MGIFEDITKHLEFDEQIISYEQYQKSPELYKDVVDAVCLLKITQDTGKTSWSWVTIGGLERALSLGGPNEMATFERTMLLVRKRDPGTPIEDGTMNGWIISREEYEEQKEGLKVLDTFVVARSKVGAGVPKIVNLSIAAYQACFRDYDLINVGYVVRPVGE